MIKQKPMCVFFEKEIIEENVTHKSCLRCKLLRPETAKWFGFQRNSNLENVCKPCLSWDSREYSLKTIVQRKIRRRQQYLRERETESYKLKQKEKSLKRKELAISRGKRSAKEFKGKLLITNFFTLESF